MMRRLLFLLAVLLFSGSSFASYYTDAHNLTMTTPGSYADTYGVNVTMNSQKVLLNVTKNYLTNATRAYVYDEHMAVQYANASFVGDVASFNLILNASTCYAVLMDAEGASKSVSQSSGGLPVPAYIVNFTKGIYAGVGYTSVYGVSSLTFNDTAAAPPAANFTALNITVLINSTNETESVPIVANVTLVGGSGLNINQSNVTVYYNNTGVVTTTTYGAPCYQETATVATSCGGLGTGAYAYSSYWYGGGANLTDGDWGTMDFITHIANLYINYSVPSGASPNSKWYAKSGDTTADIIRTIPSSCWNSTTLQFILGGVNLAGGIYYVRGSCWNTTGWQSVFLDNLTIDTYEEAMLWYMPSNSTVMNVTVVAPLVPASSTNIPWNVTVTALLSNGTVLTNSSAGNQRVDEWYNITTLTRTRALPYAVEGNNSLNIGLPSLPPHGTTAPNYLNYSYNLSICQYFFGNGTDVNATCPHQPTGNMTVFGIPATHAPSSTGYIFLDNWGNRSYNLSFNATPESQSRKNFSGLFNATREYFAWIVNSTAQPINGSLNISDLINVTFFDQNNLSAMPIDASAQVFTLAFPDGTTKNFSISYSGISAVQNASVRAYPDFYWGNVSSVEVYSKTGYIPAARFLVNANMSFASPQFVSMYLIPSTLATAATINVVEAGKAYPNAYVTVQRFYPGNSSYITVQQAITNSNGQANFFGDVTAYYRFIVYSPAYSTVYISTTPEQFTNPAGTGYSITLNLGTTYIIFNATTPVGTCYGVNSTQSIVYTFVDASGVTQKVRMLAWRYSNTTNPILLLNITYNASSASYVFPLPAGENFTLYKYACEMDIDAPPWTPFVVNLIDYTVMTQIADLAFVFICLVLSLGTAGVHPVMGIIVLTVGLVCLALVGIITPAMMPAAAIGYLVIVGAIVAIFMLPKEAS